MRRGQIHSDAPALTGPLGPALCYLVLALPVIPAGAFLTLPDLIVSAASVPAGATGFACSLRRGAACAVTESGARAASPTRAANVTEVNF